MIQCYQWPRGGVRCQRQAEGYLIQPDGRRNLGGICCRLCAEIPIKEYLEKLGETWRFEEFDLKKETQ